GLVLGSDRELVLLRARDLPLPRNVLGRVAHVVAIKGVPQAVLDHGVDHLVVAHLHAVAKMLAVRGHAHRFLAARDHDLAVAVEDGLIAERDRTQPRAAELIDTPGRALHRDAGPDRRLAGRVLALPRGEDLPQNHLGHLGAGDTRPLERLDDCNFAEVVGWQTAKRAVECANWS